VQEGFAEEHGVQCGFCTPGMLMTARALLDRQLARVEADSQVFERLTDDEIREAISGTDLSLHRLHHDCSFDPLGRGSTRAGRREIGMALQSRAERPGLQTHAGRRVAMAPIAASTGWHVGLILGSSPVVVVAAIVIVIVALALRIAAQAATAVAGVDKVRAQTDELDGVARIQRLGRADPALRGSLRKVRSEDDRHRYISAHALGNQSGDRFRRRGCRGDPADDPGQHPRPDRPVGKACSALPGRWPATPSTSRSCSAAPVLGQIHEEVSCWTTT